jgi:tRNA-specific 2-thiouridylase
MVKEGGLEFDYFATGHYSRVEFDSVSGRYLMRKGIDARKDQSYFIYRLNQDQLSKVLLPLGVYHKSRIMEIARNAGIMVHDYEESQDFYSGDYKDILNVEDAPGEITDASGKVLGHHRGIWNYTIGQRKGLGIAHSEPLYVIALDQETNRVVVGTRQETFCTGFFVSDLSWIAFDRLEQPREVAARIRSAQQEKEALIEPVDEHTIKVTFFHPTDAVTPGQSAVFYDGDLVLGGGIIN